MVLHYRSVSSADTGAVAAGRVEMSCRDIKKLVRKVEDDNQPLQTESTAKPITFACAKLCLKEMLDIYDYLGPNCSINDSKKEVEKPIQAMPPCKYGHYRDLHAPCSTSNQTSQRTQQSQQSCQQQQQQQQQQ
ncbi:unnamed protein product [Hydatigera taeniaeformis]|uniref:Expressed conserved protein n=1 Tax=Hydatigena taeniaeformis TaxID=6205 RepID=A0A0R3WHT1_HYDTA|nr:unnamed protein product [Hydatigera taeniaeformis]